MQKYSERCGNKIKDFLHKLATKLANEFRDFEHGFEDLKKRGMFTKSKTHNRVVSHQNWKKIVALMSYNAKVRLINPKNSIKTCPRYGGKTKH